MSLEECAGLMKSNSAGERGVEEERFDGYLLSGRDRSDVEWQLTRMKGQFLIIPPQSTFEPRQQSLDLRPSRIFRLPGTHRLRGNLDIYNVFNASDVLATSTAYGPTWQNVSLIATGRMLRVGVQYEFWIERGRAHASADPQEWLSRPARHRRFCRAASSRG